MEIKRSLGNKTHIIEKGIFKKSITKYKEWYYNILKYMWPNIGTPK